MQLLATAAITATLLAPWQAATPLPARGSVRYYAPGLAEQVYANRLLWQHVTACDDCTCKAAMLRNGDIGRRIWLVRQGYRPELCLVIDVANPAHLGRQLAAGAVAEVDHATAERLQMTGPIVADVWEAP